METPAHSFESQIMTSAEFSKKFTRELAKKLAKVSNNPSKLRDNFALLTHSPNHLLLSQSIKTPISVNVTPKTPQISQFQEKILQKSIKNSQKTKNNYFSTHHKENNKFPEYEMRGSEANSKKKVYKIGTLSIEKGNTPGGEADKENLLSEIKSLNEKFNFILCSDKKKVVTEGISQSAVSKDPEPESRKKLGDRTNSVFCRKSSEAVHDFDREIKEFKKFDGLDFESQRKQLEKQNLQKKIEISGLDREILHKSEELQSLQKELAETVAKLREKKTEFQSISIEYELFFQQCEFKQKQYEFSKQQENIRNDQERTELDTLRQRLERIEQELKDREITIVKKERENAEILKEIENQIQSIDMRKFEIAENLKKCYEFEADFKIRSEKLTESEKLLFEERKTIEEKNRTFDEKIIEINRKEKEIVCQTENLSLKFQEIECLERTLRKNSQECQEKETYLGKKEKEMCKVIEEIKFFSNNLKNERQMQENRLKGWEDALKKKEEELTLKERFLIEKSSKDEDLELKLLGLKMNEDTFKKKLDIEIRNYQMELQKLMEKEKDLLQREKKVAEYEKKIKNPLGMISAPVTTVNKTGNILNNSTLTRFTKNTLRDQTTLMGSKEMLKNELGKIFNLDRKGHKLQKSQSFIFLRRNMSNLDGLE